MSNKQLYSEYSIHNMVVNYLKEDGAICNGASKTYDVYKTAQGGEGGRLAFKNINDKIIRYHDVLEFLDGEVRPNIYESIPVIDFVHKENTGFLSKYYEDESGFYSMMIEDIPLSNSVSDLELIKKKDSHILNRALAGLTMSEHFFNSSGDEISDFSIQTDVPDISNPEYIYKGIKSYRASVSSSEKDEVNRAESVYYPSINIWRIKENNLHIYFSPAPSAVEIPAKINENDANLRNGPGGTYAYCFNNSNTYIINASLDSNFFWNRMPRVEGDSRPVYRFLTKDNHFLVEDITAQDGMTDSLVLNKDDILVLIPKSSYVTDSNKFLLITKDNDGNNVSYILYFDNAIGIPDSYQCIEVFYEDFLPFSDLGIKDSEGTMNGEKTFFINTLRNFVNLQEVFCSEASGLLNGYFCEPQVVEKTLQGRRVTKWRYYRPENRGLSFVGRDYDGGSFLARGSIIDEPLKLTSKDFVQIYNASTKTVDIVGGPDHGGIEALKSRGFYGKAQVYYQNLFGDNSMYLGIFNSSDNPSFSDWVIKNTTPLSLINVVTLDDIPELGQTTSRNGNIKYIQKLQTGAADIDNLITYINLFSSAIEGDTLTFSLKEGAFSVYETNVKKRMGGLIGTLGQIFIGNKKVGDYEWGENTIENFFSSIFHMEFTYNSSKESITVDNLLMKSPYEMFLPPDEVYSKRKDFTTDIETESGEEYWDANPILVYPETEDNYAFNCILMSRLDILDEGNIVSFWNNSNKKYIMMEVTKKLACLPSNITKVHYIGKELKDNKNLNTEAPYLMEWTEELSKVITVDGDPIYETSPAWETTYACTGKIADLDPGYEYWDDDGTGGFSTTKQYSVGTALYSDDGSSWHSGEKSGDICKLVIESTNYIVSQNLWEYSGPTYRKETRKTTTVKEGDVHYYDANGNELTSIDGKRPEGCVRVETVTKVLPDGDGFLRIRKEGEYGYRVDEYNENHQTLVGYEEVEVEVPVYCKIKDKSHDCYIYYLSPKKIDFSNLSIKFYDAEDKEKNINEDFFAQYILPTTNDESYFACVQSVVGGKTSYPFIEYKDNEVVPISGKPFIDSLRESAIICKLPNFVGSDNTINIGALRDQQSSISGNSLRNFYDEFLKTFEEDGRVKEQILSCAKSIYKSLLNSFKISEGSDEESSDLVTPLTFGEVKPVLKRFISLLPTLKEMVDSGMEIETDDGVKVITSDDIKNLERRISGREDYRRESYRIKQSINLQEPIKTEDWRYVAASGTVPTTHPVYYHKNGSTYEIMNPQPEAGSTLPSGTYVKSLNETLRHLLKDVIEIEGYSSGNYSGYSFEDMVVLFNEYEKGNITKELAQNIDSCFGCDTYPFIRISDDSTTSNSRIQSFITEYGNTIKVWIYQVAASLVSEQKRELIDFYVEQLKNEYKKYFTASSVNSATTSNPGGDGNAIINSDSLELNVGSSSNPNTVVESVFKSIWETDKSKVTKSLSSVTLWLVGLSNNSSAKEVMTKFGLYTDTSPHWLIKSIKPYVLKIIKDYILKSILKEHRDAYTKSVPNGISLQKILRFLSSSPFSASLDGDKLVGEWAIPDLDSSLNLVVPSSASKEEIFRINYVYAPVDINHAVLDGLLKYIRFSLSGIDYTDNSSTGNPSLGVVSVSGKQSVPHPESLYGMRYKILNGRMNKINGPLYNAANLVRSSSFFNDYNRISDQIIDSYSMFVNVLPVTEMEGMSYLPSQQASMTTVPLAGKFYSDKEMESLRNQINSQCILTCTRCDVKDSCPFYDQNEVINMACTPMETIDLYLKDNELELIDEDSIEVVSIPEGGHFDKTELSQTHMEFGEILARKKEESSDIYDLVDVSSLNQKLIRATGLGYNYFSNDESRWIMGGRYGTVEYMGDVKDLIKENYPELEDKIPNYKYCYDALFIKLDGKDNSKIFNQDDKVPYMLEDSYIGYRLSKNAYPVTYELGPAGQKKEYKVKVKLKMPAYIKMFKDSGKEDDVYLVSDDTKDPDGKSIDPIIYLGKIRDIKYTFDIIEDDPNNSNHGIQSADDMNTYASDVAQWCMNYIKGHCIDDPVGVGEAWHNRDQYWMDSVYKYITDGNEGTSHWQEFPGRPRRPSGYQEPVVGVDDFDEISALTGKPVINTYYDFVRRVSIRIYDGSIQDENKRWLIPWVNERLLSSVNDKDKIEELKEQQRAVLPLMKTNLRFVVVKN